MLLGDGSEADHVAANPHVVVDCALVGNDEFPDVTIVPDVGVGLLATREKQIRADNPFAPVAPAYPDAKTLAVVQLIVDVVEDVNRKKSEWD